jgi:hypothetical protein
MNPTDHYLPVSQWPAKLRPAADFLAHAFALLRYGGNKHPENAKRDALALAAHLSGYWRPKELGEAINVAVGGGRASSRTNVITQGLGKNGKREGLADLGLFLRDPPDGRSAFRITLTAKGTAVAAADRADENTQNSSVGDPGEQQDRARARQRPSDDG